MTARRPRSDRLHLGPRGAVGSHDESGRAVAAGPSVAPLEAEERVVALKFVTSN